MVKLAVQVFHFLKGFLSNFYAHESHYSPEPNCRGGGRFIKQGGLVFYYKSIDSGGGGGGEKKKW